MPRGKKPSLPKNIVIGRESTNSSSAHILNLREKIVSPPPPRWQPSELAQTLAHPWKFIKPKRLNRLKISLPSLNLPTITLPEFTWSAAWSRPALAFAVLCLIFILPLPTLSAYEQLSEAKGQIINIGQDAFSHLYQGSTAALSLNLNQAIADLAKATELFSASQKEISQINPLWRTALSVLPVLGDKYKSGQHLLAAGQNLTLAVEKILSTANNFADLPNPVAAIWQIEKTAALALPELTQASQHLALVNPANLSPEARPQFELVKNQLQKLTTLLSELPSITPILRQLLGEGGKKRYLMVFQNNGEIRPTGGFMGSLALVDLQDGLIQKIWMPGGGPFDLAGNLKVFVKTPAPLQIMRTRWELQDANWFADFPTSAKKIAWFYEKSGGGSVDGIVAIDALFFREILRLTGPIAMPEYKKIIDYDNFIAESQKQVEFEYDPKLNRPKQFLADLAPRVLAKLFAEKNNLIDLLTVLEQAARAKHWQMFAPDPVLQSFLNSQGLAGEIKDNPGGDFLSIINTNIAGQKTDWVMEQSTQHQLTIENDGSMINTVTIIRTHHGLAGELLTGVQNVNYLRLYAPLGSQLLTASGFKQPQETDFKVPEKWYTDDTDLVQIESKEKIDAASGTRITEEFGKTVFANWTMTAPGATSVVTFSYRLPFKFNGAYSLLVQKQAGSDRDLFTNKIILPSGYQTRDSQGAVNDKILLREDQFLGIVASK